tara:strand:- start:2918 stop:3754 length:837 start_codon:yes stop_codon:yes gene_type:complete
MSTLFVIVGGLGKSIIWTSLIEKLNAKYGQKISVMSPWPLVFHNNENIDRIESLLHFHYYEQLKIYDDIIYHEPYFSDFLQHKDKHVLESWAQAYEIEDVINKPYLNNKSNIDDAHKYLSEPVLNDYCIVQFTATQNYYDTYAGENKSSFSIKSYYPTLIEKLIHKIKHNLNLDIICLRRDTDHKPSNTITYDPPDYGGVLDVISLINEAKFIVCIDSSLMHIAATTNKTKEVIVLWNETQQSYKRVGYDFFTNMSCSNNMYNDIPPEEIFSKIKEVL